MSIQAMLEQSREFDSLKSDYVHPARAVRFGQDMSVQVPADLFNGTVALTPTGWAVQQACQKLTVPYSYMQRCPSRLEAVNLNYWRTRLPPDRTWMVRGYEDSARAILSDRYFPIGITKVLEWVDELGLAEGHTLVRPYMDADSLYLKIKVLADPDDDNYGYGVYVREGEIGNLALGVAGFIQRHSCENSIIFDDEEALRVIHLAGRYTLMEVRTLFKIKANQAMRVAVEKRDAIAQAEAEEVENFSAVVDRLCRAQGFSEEVHDSILMGTENQRTVMGVVNGVSFAAQSIADPKEATRMESLAGRILVHPDSLFGNVAREAAELEV